MSPAVDAGIICPEGQLLCGEKCVDVQVDTANCGACGTSCTSGQVCTAGACVSTCAEGLTSCGTACADLNTDRANCGKCGTACASGEVCVAGACKTSCPGMQVVCGGACVDPATDRGFCGASKDCAGANAGAKCKDGEVCSAGACATSCGAGLTECTGTCRDLQTDFAHCGMCGKACATGEACVAGTCKTSCPGAEVVCGGSCVDPKSDRAFCGAKGDCAAANAGTACKAGEVCAAGACQTSCPSGQVVCGSTCVDPKTDRAFCGATADCNGANAGVACKAGEVCVAGACQTSCPGSEIVCGSTCVDPKSDRAFCGATTGCSGASAGKACANGEVCVNGACTTSCPGSQIACGNACVNAASDHDFCGAKLDCAGANAGVKCKQSEVCVAGACQQSCPVSQIACSGTCVDPLTDRGFCGAQADCAGLNAGVACKSGEVCVLGACKTSCPGSQIACNGACIEPLTSRDFCGAKTDCTGTNAGAVCKSGEVCVSGVCQTSCPGTQIACNGACIEPSSDHGFCGARLDCSGANVGVACKSGEVCVNGACQTSCPGTQIACGGACVEPTSDRLFCGATTDCTGANAGTACKSGEVCVAGNCITSCPTGQLACGGTCVDPTSDRLHCGASADCSGATAGVACKAGEVCVNSVCQTSCPGSQIVCGGACVDASTDPLHCGAKTDCTGANAGVACPSGQACVGGACQTQCPGTQIVCGGACVNASSDNTYCGAKLDCGGTNAGKVCKSGEVCVSGACQTSCPGSQIVCAGSCVDASTDRNHCGAKLDCAGANVGAVCKTGEICVSGACRVSCPGTQVDCGDGICRDLSSDSTKCGSACATAVACAGGKVCKSGACSTSCPSGQVDCGDGICRTLATDSSKCGTTCANAVACTGGKVCQSGACGTSCPSGQVDCGDGICRTLSTDSSKCGTTCANAVACTGGKVCKSGVCGTSCPGTQVDCGDGVCRDLSTDSSKCGTSCAAATACTGGKVCRSGVCGTSCPGTQVDCGDGVCRDLSSDSTKCGTSCAAATACTGGKVCVSGACKVQCPTGQLDCGDGVCRDLSTDATKCGTTCANAVACTSGKVCKSGACGVQCAGSQVDCGDGVCRTLASDDAKCGTSCTNAVVCGTGTTCTNGACVGNCGNAGLVCNNACVDPNTDRTYCGASADCAGTNAGVKCAATETCIGGACTQVTFKYPQACDELSSGADGDYTLYLAHKATQPYLATCVGVGTGTAKTYLVLGKTPTVGGPNWSQYYAPTFYYSGTAVNTLWTKVRFDPATLTVTMDDYAFSTSSGSAVRGSGTPVTQQPYAQGGDCDRGFTPRGNGNVDLSATPFAIDSTIKWVPVGFNQSGNSNINVTRQVATFIGGGECGGIAPFPGGDTSKPATLKLAYVGHSKSCLDIKTKVPTATDGVYTIDPDGVGGLPAFDVYCDMTTDGGGWTKVLQYAGAAYTAQAAAFGNVAVAGTPAAAKLSDAQINALGTGRMFRVTGGGASTKRVYFTSSSLFTDTARGWGVSNGASTICEGADLASCTFTGTASRSTFDTNSMGSSPDDCDRYFVDYDFAVQCYQSQGPAGTRCLTSGVSCAANSRSWQLIPNVALWVKELATPINCADVLTRTPSATNGKYTIDPDGFGAATAFDAYCDMTGDGGGWTLALKADGGNASSQFLYGNALWTNTATLNPTSTDLSGTEAKFASFYGMGTAGVRLVMKDSGGTLRSLVLPNVAKSLLSLTASPGVGTAAGRNAWLSMLPSGGIQPNCNQEGFNLVNNTKARIGILGNQEGDCLSNDSAFGFGIENGGAGQCSYSAQQVAAVGSIGGGGCTPSGADARAFGFVYVK